MKTLTKAEPATELEVLPAKAGELESCENHIRLYCDLYHRADTARKAVAYLAGLKLMQMKELVGHNKFIPACEKSFPEQTQRTLQNWMSFADGINQHYPTVGKYETVSHLLPERVEEPALLALAGSIDKVSEGRGMMAMIREFHNANRKRHPIKMTEEEKVQAEIAHANDTLDHIAGLIRSVLADDDKTIALGDKVRCKVLDDLRIDLGKALAEKLKKKGGAK